MPPNPSPPRRSPPVADATRPILEAAIAALPALLDADAGVILLPGAEPLALQVVARRGMTGKQAAAISALLVQPEIRRLLSRGGAFHPDIGEAISARLRDELREQDWPPLLAVPLPGTGDPPGALALLPTGDDGWPEPMVEAALRAGELLATSLRAAVQAISGERRRGQAGTLLARLPLFGDQTLAPDRALDRVVSGVGAALELSHCLGALRAARPVFAEYCPPGHNPIGPLALPPEHPLWRRLRAGDAWQVDLATAAPADRSLVSALLGGARTRSLLVAPVHRDAVLLGAVLLLQDDRERQFSEDERRFLRAAAAELGAALASPSPAAAANRIASSPGFHEGGPPERSYQTAAAAPTATPANDPPEAARQPQPAQPLKADDRMVGARSPSDTGPAHPLEREPGLAALDLAGHRETAPASANNADISVPADAPLGAPLGQQHDQQRNPPDLAAGTVASGRSDLDNRDEVAASVPPAFDALAALLVSAIPEGVLLLDFDGAVVLANPAAERLLGRPLAGLTLAELHEAIHPGAADACLEGGWPLGQALRGETVTGGDLALTRADRTETPLLVNAAPLHDPAGRLTGAVCIFQDLSPLHELATLKNDFINTVSHELRTPITTIRGGAITLLTRGDRLDAETRAELLQDISDEAERLRLLVEDLLSLTRSRQGIGVSPEPVLLHRLVQQTIAEVDRRLSGHTLAVEVSPELPPVETDPALTQQVLRNLIENAVKFSPAGGLITLTAAPEGERILVSVLDQGSGIPAGDMERLFEPFYRPDSTVRSGAQGAGLGLAVCRRLVELQGERIWAEARPEGGAAFRFTIPVASADGGE